MLLWELQLLVIVGLESLLCVDFRWKICDSYASFWYCSFFAKLESKSGNEKEKIVLDFLDENENLCIDGNYSKIFFDERMEKADFIVVMLFNRFNSLWRVWKRFKKYKGQSRPDMTVGCDEKLDFEFFRWVLFFRQLTAWFAGF